MIRWGLDYLKRGYEVYCKRIDEKLEELECKYQEASDEYEMLYHDPVDAVK
jgi:hypothetical protein